MKEMLLQETMYWSVIQNLNSSFLEMLNPIEASISYLRWNARLYSTGFNVSRKNTWAPNVTDVFLLQIARHELKTAGRKMCMHLLLVDPDSRVSTPPTVEEKVAE
jgi:hypothetical protein